MHIPGLKDALSRLDVVDNEMLPLLRRMADSLDRVTVALDRLVELVEDIDAR